jgi:hypothetical protein
MPYDRAILSSRLSGISRRQKKNASESVLFLFDFGAVCGLGLARSRGGFVFLAFPRLLGEFVLLDLPREKKRITTAATTSPS